MRKPIPLLLLLVFLGVLSGEAIGESAAKPTIRPSENIALGVTYKLSATPDYRHCTDVGDATQLTDGIYSEGYFWTQPGTVGWQGHKPVIITIDLGAVRPIRGVSYNSGAGCAGVEWPSAIGVYTADKEGEFYFAGELVSMSAAHGLPALDVYGTHCYWTDALRTHGRYVALVVYASPFAFTDEIEVYAGEADWLGVPMEGTPVADLKAEGIRFAVTGAVKRRYLRDIQAVRELAAGLSQDMLESIRPRLDVVGTHVASLEGNYDKTFRTILPFDEVHAQVFRAQAEVWRVAGRPPLMAWSSPLWDALPHVALPQENAPNLSVAMMRNEYRAAAFNLSNSTQEDVAVRLSITGLPGGANPEYITVHEVSWTDTSSGRPVAAALPEVQCENGVYRIGLPSGLTQQVWLTFHPVEIEAGDYSGKVKVVSDIGIAEIPLSFRLYPMRFPDRPTLHFGGWDYTNGTGHRGVTAVNRLPLIQHLSERFVDSPWATSAAMPRGVYDGEGNMTKAPSTANFDDWVSVWSDARQYLVFAAVHNTFGSWQEGTPLFDKAVGEWVRFWAGHAQSKGIDPVQVGLLLVDEPHAPEQDATILAWAKAIRAADTGIRIWEDPTYKDMSKVNPEMIAVCDVLCPNRPIFLRVAEAYRDFYAEQREKGIALELYSCSGPARLLDPYGYYRLQAWDCWRFGAEASYFWAFADTSGASSWNEYAIKRTAYTPLFLDDEKAVAGKQMEACREGIEDYEYLVMLRAAIDLAEKSGATPESLATAQDLLKTLPERVAASSGAPQFSWTNEKVDRGVADAARVQILDVLAGL